MYCNIALSVQRIKQNVAAALSEQAIERALRQAKHPWRRRELGPAKTIWAFLLQVLHGNTACQHVVRIARLTCSATAYCRARARLPLAVYEHLFSQTTQAARSSASVPRWRGHRTFVIDGTGISMPDTAALRERFGTSGQQSVGCGFPVAHLVAMFDSATGLLVQAWTGPLRSHDLRCCVPRHSALFCASSRQYSRPALTIQLRTVAFLAGRNHDQVMATTALTPSIILRLNHQHTPSDQRIVVPAVGYEVTYPRASRR